MAFGVLQYPGTEKGPCGSPCVHRDCAESREMAEAICPGCKQSIGFGRAFTKYNGLWHLSCLEDSNQ